MYSYKLSLSGPQKNYITQTVTSGRNRDPKWRIALALTIARALPLVQSDDPEEYYAATLRNAARNLVSISVETIPYDLEGVESMVESFWHARYQVAFGQDGLVSVTDQSTLASAMGIHTKLSPIVQTTFQTNDITEVNRVNEDLRMLRSIIRLTQPENQV